MAGLFGVLGCGWCVGFILVWYAVVFGTLRSVVGGVVWLGGLIFGYYDFAGFWCVCIWDVADGLGAVVQVWLLLAVWLLLFVS